MSVEERTLVRPLASQSGRAPGVYPSHRLYLLTGLLTRLIGTEKTDIERSRRSARRAETSETPRRTSFGPLPGDVWERVDAREEIAGQFQQLHTADLPGPDEGRPLHSASGHGRIS